MVCKPGAGGSPAVVAGFLSAGTTHTRCAGPGRRGNITWARGRLLRRPGGYRRGHGRRSPQPPPAGWYRI